MLDGDKKCEDGRGERPLQAALTVSTAFLAHLQLGDIKVWGWDGMDGMDGMGWDGMGWMGWDGKRDGMGRGMELCNTVLRHVLGGALNLFHLFMYLSRTYTHICMLDCVYICIHEYTFVCPCVWLGVRQEKKREK